MGAIREAFETVWRDYVTAGVPASGDHEPVKSEIRAIGATIETAFGASLGNVDVAYATLAELNADLAWAAASTAIVYADPDPANIDLYVKSGASGAGSWSNTGALQLLAGAITGPAVARARNSVPFESWEALTDATGMIAGDRATVLGVDEGQHTDPVAGGTVDNAGVYEYSDDPAGWERVGALDSAAAVDAAEAAAATLVLAEGAANASAASAAEANALVETTLPLQDFVIFDEVSPRVVRAETSIGRAFMLPSGAFAFAESANQLRTHYESGKLKGFYSEVAETIASARWHDQVPGSGDPHFIASSNRGTGATQAYAGQHAAPDRFGGTGGAVLVTQGTTTVNGQVRFNNLAVAGVAGDIMRAEAFFSILSVTGAATFRPLRTRQISGTVPQITAAVDFDAAGVVNPATFAPPAANVALRSRIELCEETVVDGLPVWKVWVDIPLNASGTMALAFDEPSALVASQIVIHEMRIVKNPKGKPSPIPVCQAAPAFAADKLRIGSGDEFFDVEFRRLGRKHSRQAGDAVQVPAVAQGENRYAISGPLWPYENELVISAATEATGYGGILPTRDSLLDMTQLQLRKSWSLRAKGYFAERIGTESAGGAGNIDLRGFSDTDLLELPWVRLTTSGLELNNLRLDAILYAASSQFTSQTEQVEVGENIVVDIQTGGNFTMMVGGMVSHPLAHSRARRFSFPRVQANGENPTFVGTFIIKPQAATVQTMKNITASGVARCWQIVANGSTLDVTWDYDNWDIERFSSDGFYPGRGDGQAGSVMQNIVLRDSTYLRENFFQNAPDMPIWVDTGAGFVSIETYAAGLGHTVQEAVDTLPLGRSFQYYGYLDAPYTGSPNRSLSNLVVDPSTVSYAAIAEPATTNTGTGAISGLAAVDPLAEGVYLLTITGAAANAGTFQVTGPANYYAVGTVGVAFSRGGLSFTLADGATDFVVGDTVKLKIKRFEYERGTIEITRFNVRETITANIAADKPGYQFHATNRRFGPDYNDNVLPVDTAWLATNDEAPSPSNPHMLVVRGDKRYVFNTGLWGGAAITDNTGVLENSGVHADPSQWNRTGITNNGLTLRNWVIRSRGQGGIYAPGTEPNMFVGLNIENVFIAVTGSNAILLGPGTVTATLDKVFVAPLWTSQVFANGSKNAPGIRLQGGTVNLTRCFVARPAISAVAENGTGLVVDAGATAVGSVAPVRAGQQVYNITEAPTTRRSGGVVVAPAITALVANPAMIENGYFSAKGDLRDWYFSPFAIKHFGFDPMLGQRNVESAAVDRKTLHHFAKNVLQKHPVAHGEMPNTAAVGDEVVLYDERGAVVRLPGHSIDFHFGDGYGKDGPWEITDDGRVLLRWSLAGRDIFRRVLTRAPDGTYGPIFTIDVVVP